MDHIKRQLKEHHELLADHEIMIAELKNLNVRLHESLEYDKRRVYYIYLPWWKKVFALKP